MKLYFNGCSHTWGDDLADPARQAWPALISARLGCDFLNNSVSGGTNDRIMYQTIKHADQFDKFYIAWTYTTRFTRYRPDNNFEINFNPSFKNTLYEKNSEFVDYATLHYKYWYNELYSFKIWLQNIILLQRYLDSVKKPYVMINASHNQIGQWTKGWPSFKNSVKSMLCFDQMNDHRLFQEHQEIQNLLAQIDLNNYVGWEDWCITDLSSVYCVGATGHLLNDGHRAIADYILKHDPT